jgi:hypothetical protein
MVAEGTNESRPTIPANTAKPVSAKTRAAQPARPLSARPSSEIMRQPVSVSRAGTMGGEATPLPPELKAEIERQAGRKLSDEEAIALDRTRAEREMATPRPDEASAIREAHRGKLEQAGRPAESKPATKPAAAPITSRAESLSTYYKLSQEARDYIDSQVQGLREMPQILREARERELQQYGPKGTMLKERLAREVAKQEGMNIERGGPAPTLSNSVRIKELQARERDLIDQSSRARSWPKANELIRKAKAVNEKMQKLKDSELGDK